MFAHSDIPPSLLLAEQLTPEQAWDLNHASDSTTPPFADAWGNLEVAICKADRRPSKIADIQERFEDCASQQSGADRYKAALALACMPSFIQRIRRQPYNIDIIEKVHRNLGDTMLDLPYATDDSARGAYLEALALALAARKGKAEYLASTASVREEQLPPVQINDEEETSFNHDLYVPREWKVPLQVKSAFFNTKGEDRRRSNEAIGWLYMRDMVCIIAKIHRPVLLPGEYDLLKDPRRPGEGVADRLLGLVSELIAREIDFNDLTRQEKRFLNHLTQRVTIYIDDTYNGRTRRSR